MITDVAVLTNLTYRSRSEARKLDVMTFAKFKEDTEEKEYKSTQTYSITVVELAATRGSREIEKVKVEWIT
jgi:hypothetical protein